MASKKKRFTIRTLFLLFLPFSCVLAADAATSAKLQQHLKLFEAGPNTYFESVSPYEGEATWNEVGQIQDRTTLLDRLQLRRTVVVQHSNFTLLKERTERRGVTDLLPQAATQTLKSEIHVQLFAEDKISIINLGEHRIINVKRVPDYATWTE